MEIAATRDLPEVLSVLAEFTELPVKVKLLRLLGGGGTIFQDAVEMGKVNFFRDLLEFG